MRSGPKPWDWLRIVDLGHDTVSSDGQVIEGRFSAFLAASGATINALWKFTALPE